MDAPWIYLWYHTQRGTSSIVLAIKQIQRFILLFYNNNRNDFTRRGANFGVLVRIRTAHSLTALVSCRSMYGPCGNSPPDGRFFTHSNIQPVSRSFFLLLCKIHAAKRLYKLYNILGNICHVLELIQSERMNIRRRNIYMFHQYYFRRLPTNK